MSGGWVGGCNPLLEDLFWPPYLFIRTNSRVSFSMCRLRFAANICIVWICFLKTGEQALQKNARFLPSGWVLAFQEKFMRMATLSWIWYADVCCVTVESAVFVGATDRPLVVDGWDGFPLKIGNRWDFRTRSKTPECRPRIQHVHEPPSLMVLRRNAASPAHPQQSEHFLTQLRVGWSVG